MHNICLSAIKDVKDNSNFVAVCTTCLTDEKIKY